MSPAQAWKLLGIARSGDSGAVRRAYAELLKASDPDADPAAFARLRDARDTALANARAIAAKGAPVEELPELEEDDDDDYFDDTDYFDESGGSDEHPAPLAARPEPWLYSAASLDAATRSEGSVVVPLPDSKAPMPLLNPDFGAGSAQDGAPLPADPWAVPALSPAQAKDTEHLVLKRTAADHRLWGLLYANGDADTAQFTIAELKEAQSAQADVLDDATASNLAMHGVIENWLANALAGAWPRSAPLLDAASGYFGWEREAGKLGERPSVAFLNARLKGMRFETKVLDPKHRLHKAWIELQREGRRDMLSGLRASKQDVRTLLEGVRKNFPELEDHLDAQRVGSWEGESGTSGRKQFGGPRKSYWFIGVVVLIRLLIVFSHDTGSPQNSQFNPNDSAFVAKPDTLALEQDAISEVFGVSASTDWLTLHQPEMAKLIRANIASDEFAKTTKEETIRRIVVLIRERIYENGREDSAKLFDGVMRLRLAQMREAQSLGTDTCTTFLTTDDFGNATVSPGLRDREREFAYKYVESGSLDLPAQRAAANAVVPGAIVKRVMEATHLGHDAVAAAMVDKTDRATKCAVTAELLQATLAWKGKERWAILKTL